MLERRNCNNSQSFKEMSLLKLQSIAKQHKSSISLLNPNVSLLNPNVMQSLQTAHPGVLAVRQASEPVPLQREYSDDSSDEPDGNVALKLVSCDGGIVQEETAKEGYFTELVEESDELSWIVTISVPCLPDYQTLVVRNKMTGIIASEAAEVTYKIILKSVFNMLFFILSNNYFLQV